MALLDRLFGTPRTKPEDPGAGVARYLIPPKPTANVTINEDTALTLSTYFDCIRVLGETLAGLPWRVHERQGEDRKLRDDHALDFLLHRRPNGEMTSFPFKELLVSWAANWGNGYAEIARDGRGLPVGLWPIAAHRVQVERRGNGSVIAYKIQTGGLGIDPFWIPARDMLHIKGPTTDGIVGRSIATTARESLGLTMAAEQFGASFFGNGTSVGSVLIHPGKIKKESQDQLRDSIRKFREGPSNQHRFLLLDEAMDWKQIGTPPEDAQFLETRKFQVAEICRWFRMPPHKVGFLDRATWNNIEQQELEFKNETITPWALRMEQEADWKLLANDEQLYTKFNLAALNRGDSQTRTTLYKGLQDMGVVTINEIRRLEDMDPIGPDGDVRLISQQLQRLEDVVKEPEPVPAALQGPPPPGGEEEEDEEDADQKVEDLKKATARLFAAACETVLRKEARAAERAAKRHAEDPAGFAAWASDFYGAHELYVARTMHPPAETLADLLAATYRTVADDAAFAFADQHCEQSREDLRQAYAAGNVPATCKEWFISRPGEAAVYLTEHVAERAHLEEVTV
jgi:HK97 family phage portal protein